MVSPYRVTMNVHQYIRMIARIASSFSILQAARYVPQRNGHAQYASTSCAGAGLCHLSCIATSAGKMKNLTDEYFLTLYNSAGTCRVERLLIGTRHQPPLRITSRAPPSIRTPRTHLRYHLSLATSGALDTALPSCLPSQCPFPRGQMVFVLPL